MIRVALALVFLAVFAGNAAASAVERDLNGNGRADLLLAHDRLVCKGSNKISS